MEVGLRPTEYVPVEGYYLLRHKFGNAYFVWCIPRKDFSGELDGLVVRATSQTPTGSIPGITELQDEIDSKCADIVDKLNEARLLVEKAYKAPMPQKRKLDRVPASRDAKTKKIRKCQTTNESLKVFEQLSDEEKVATFSMVIANSNRLDVLKENTNRK